MSDDETQTDTEAEGQDTGQDNDEREDFDAQAALAAAAQEADDAADEDDGLDPKVRQKIAKANREAQNLRGRLKELEGAAKRLKEIEDKDKTETTKLAEERDSLKSQLHELTVANVRREAASEAGLPGKFARFITAEDEDDALAQAKELAKELGISKGKTKSPDLRQGNRGPANAGQVKPDADDLLRRMARR